jgi:hypothetical protein
MVGDIGVADVGARIAGFGLFFDIGTNLVPGNEVAADRDRERISRFGFRAVMCA